MLLNMFDCIQNEQDICTWDGESDVQKIEIVLLIISTCNAYKSLVSPTPDLIQYFGASFADLIFG